MPDSKKDVVVALTAHGIAEGVAKRLAKRYGKKRMEEKIEYLDFLLAIRPAEVKKPAAWLRRAIEENYSEPDGYISQEKREKLTAEEKKQAEEAERQAAAAEADHKAVQEEKQAEQAARVRALREEYGTSEEDLELWEKAQTELKYTATPDINALIPELEMLHVRDGTVLLGAWTEATWRRLQHPGTAKMVERALSQAAGEVRTSQVVEIAFGKEATSID